MTGFAGPVRPCPSRVIIATCGSLGDLYPYLALGVGLRARGHAVTLAVSADHRARVEAAGLAWRHMRPDPPTDAAGTAALYAKLLDPKAAAEFVFKHFAAPRVRDSYADLHAAVAEGCDLLLSTPLSLAAPLLAEREGLRWASAMLQPMRFVSAHDPPILAEAPRLTGALRRIGPLYGAALRAFGRWSTRSWSTPVRALRRELGLPLPGPDPLWEGQHSPALVLAMFPRALAAPQRDWPPRTKVTGALFWEETEGAQGLAPDVERFLAEGPPPIVFTLGSAAVNAQGNFYAASLDAAGRLGHRALLLIGSASASRAQLPDPLPPWALAVAHLPHGRIFARASAIVHAGGMGTLAQAMRAGRPMLVVPFANDQPDNAARAARLGVARVLPSSRYDGPSATRELAALLADARLARVAEATGQDVRAEDGVGAACDALEALLPRAPAA